MVHLKQIGRVSWYLELDAVDVHRRHLLEMRLGRCGGAHARGLERASDLDAE